MISREWFSEEEESVVLIVSYKRIGIYISLSFHFYSSHIII